MKKLLFCLLGMLMLFTVTSCNNKLTEKEVKDSTKVVMVLDTVENNFIQADSFYETLFERQVTFYGYRKNVSEITPIEENKMAVFFSDTSSVALDFTKSTVICDTIIYR